MGRPERLFPHLWRLSSRRGADTFAASFLPRDANAAPYPVAAVGGAAECRRRRAARHGGRHRHGETPGLRPGAALRCRGQHAPRCRDRCPRGFRLLGAPTRCLSGEGAFRGVRGVGTHASHRGRHDAAHRTGDPPADHAGGGRDGSGVARRHQRLAHRPSGHGTPPALQLRRPAVAAARRHGLHAPARHAEPHPAARGGQQQR